LVKRIVFSSAAAVFALSLALAAQQQPPQTTTPPATAQAPQGQGRGGPQPAPKNLQVLPATMSRQEVTGVMRGFTQALGVRCPYCHAGEEGQPLNTFDFAADTKPTKGTARVMMKMVNDLNSNYLASVGSKPAGEPRVSCYTCHRGEAKPAVAAPAAQRGGIF
jgi:hypothetical protein